MGHQFMPHISDAKSTSNGKKQLYNLCVYIYIYIYIHTHTKKDYITVQSFNQCSFLYIIACASHEIVFQKRTLIEWLNSYMIFLYIYIYFFFLISCYFILFKHPSWVIFFNHSGRTCPPPCLSHTVHRWVPYLQTIPLPCHLTLGSAEDLTAQLPCCK